MARGRPGWPCPEVRCVMDDCFNSVYQCDDEEDFYIFHWVDNNIITIDSSIHTGKEKRKNPTNKNHLPQIFRDKPVADIEVPGVVDD